MKFSALAFLAAPAILASLAPSVSAHMALLEPTPRGGYKTSQFDSFVHTFIGKQPKGSKKKNQPFACGGYAPGPITDMKAGEVINVRFLASPMMKMDKDHQKNPKKYPDVIKKMPARPSNPSKQMQQARHGGGLCQFSISPDNGKTFHLIGQYTKTCPDAYYKWPVRIPKNAPPCEKKGCLFVWSWTANILPQYYHNCADIRLKNSNWKKGKDKNWPSKSKRSIQIVDFDGRKKNVKEPGDGKNHKSSSGPNSKEKKSNQNGMFSIQF
ncbi:hypothetical protein B0O80DRAFT_420765 [Mortierella sp. GBAus27b]|nr:hypothetical protein BGX31_009478 [Mortierella sp. GBA43]KAI8362939.1 hypothetical protein B0O80DRAFT_420765 [Mortierella sp. GBAus27b]